MRSRQSRISEFEITRLAVLAALLAAPLFSAAWVSAQTGSPSANTAGTTGYRKRDANSSTPSGPTPRTLDGKPDFSGVWNGPGEYINQGLPGGQLPYTAAGQAAYQDNMTKAVDPQSLCILIGQPRADLDGQVFEIFQTPQRIAFLYERDDSWRLVQTDDRSHPAHPEPSFFGDAIGKWDGDTLVVDVVGIKGQKIWTDNVGHPQSDTLHLIERWTRPDADHLQIDLTIDDPKYYTKPLQLTRKMTRQRYEVIEMSCDENNVDREHLGNGLGTKDGTRGFDKNLNTARARAN
jgi:hypothetical protein